MKDKQAKLLEKAVTLAVKAHAGQRDKSGEPYVLHPLRMMLRSATFEEKLTSILHDVIEDSDYTLEDLRDEGCPDEVLVAIDHLSRRKDESYEEFVERAITNPLARKVKIKDLEDKMNLRHYAQIDEKTSQKLSKYHRAWQRANDLEQLSEEAPFTEHRRFVF